MSVCNGYGGSQIQVAFAGRQYGSGYFQLPTGAGKSGRVIGTVDGYGYRGTICHSGGTQYQRTLDHHFFRQACRIKRFAAVDAVDIDFHGGRRGLQTVVFGCADGFSHAAGRIFYFSFGADYGIGGNNIGRYRHIESGSQKLGRIFLAGNDNGNRLHVIAVFQAGYFAGYGNGCLRRFVLIDDVVAGNAVEHDRAGGRGFIDEKHSGCAYRSAGAGITRCIHSGNAGQYRIFTFCGGRGEAGGFGFYTVGAVGLYGGGVNNFVYGNRNSFTRFAVGDFARNGYR